MKVLYRTERTPAVSVDMGLGRPARQGVAWFEDTIAYWRAQFARLRNPHPWTIEVSGVKGVAPAIIPDEAIAGLPEDARISFVWTFISAEIASKSGAP